MHKVSRRDAIDGRCCMRVTRRARERLAGNLRRRRGEGAAVMRLVRLPGGLRHFMLMIDRRKKDDLVLPGADGRPVLAVNSRVAYGLKGEILDVGDRRGQYVLRRRTAMRV